MVSYGPLSWAPAGFWWGGSVLCAPVCSSYALGSRLGVHTKGESCEPPICQRYMYIYIWYLDILINCFNPYLDVCMSVPICVSVPTCIPASIPIFLSIRIPIRIVSIYIYVYAHIYVCIYIYVSIPISCIHGLTISRTSKPYDRDPFKGSSSSGSLPGANRHPGGSFSAAI